MSMQRAFTAHFSEYTLANRAIRCATLRSRMALRRLRHGNGAGKHRPRWASLDWQRHHPSPRRARRLMDRHALQPNAFLHPAISRGSVHSRADRRSSRGRSTDPSNSGRHIDADGLRVTLETGAGENRNRSGVPIADSIAKPAGSLPQSETAAHHRPGNRPLRRSRCGIRAKNPAAAEPRGCLWRR